MLAAENSNSKDSSFLSKVSSVGQKELGTTITIPDKGYSVPSSQSEQIVALGIDSQENKIRGLRRHPNKISIRKSNIIMSDDSMEEETNKTISPLMP